MRNCENSLIIFSPHFHHSSLPINLPVLPLSATRLAAPDGWSRAAGDSPLVESFRGERTAPGRAAGALRQRTARAATLPIHDNAASVFFVPLLVLVLGGNHA